MPPSKNGTVGKKKKNSHEDTIQLGQYYKDTGEYDTDSLSSHSSQPAGGIAQVTRIRPWTVQSGHGPNSSRHWTKDKKAGPQPKTASSGDFTPADRQRVYSAQTGKGARLAVRQVWGESLDELGGGDDNGDHHGNDCSSDFGGNVDFCGDYSYCKGRSGERGDYSYHKDDSGEHSFDHNSSDDNRSFDRSGGKDFLDLAEDNVSSDHVGDEPTQPWSVTEVLQFDLNELEPRTSSVILANSSLDVSTEIGVGEEEEEQEEERLEEEEAEGKDICERDRQRWFEGPRYDSDDYDTDLEEDFPPEPTPPADASGVYEYQVQCERLGIIPVTFLVENIGDSSLRMKYRYLGGQGTKPLAAALKKNTVCEEIDLSDNYLEGSGAVALAKMLQDNMFIVTLNISNNAIRSKGCAAFAEMLDTNTTLKTLSLKGNELVDGDAKRLAEALRNNMSLNCLDLSYNSFGEAGGIYLAAGLTANYGLADLDLSWNSISMKGALALGKALTKNTSLEVLDLSWNGLQSNGGIAIGQALKVNKTLRVLDLSNNNLNPEAAKAIAQGLSKNQSVETIMMGNNPIGQVGVEALLKGIAVNNRLKLVGIEDLTMQTDKTIQEKIDEIQSSRDILIMYSINRPIHCKINRTILAVFERFVVENAERMEDLFNQMDKDHSGDITLEEFKYGLRDFGLRLTSKQLDMLLEELDSDRSGTIEFRGCTRMKELEVELEQLRLLVVAEAARCGSGGKGAGGLCQWKEMGGKTNGLKESGVGATVVKESGGKEMTVKVMGVRETGGRVSEGKVTGAQVSQATGGIGDRLMSEREPDNSLPPSDKTAGQNVMEEIHR
ncbi:hypothetical protein LSAT2_025016 [Lamellibrachia satsuma]|nr:hypothetical protein LSAT2_025016 [Lamellibrachia satsuma]